MRCGVSCLRIASPASIDMARELIQIGIDAQYSSPKMNVKLRADDIAWPFSRVSIEPCVRNIATAEVERVICEYEKLGYVNLKIDAGSVLRCHTTHAIADNPTCQIIPWIMDAAQNLNWDTHDYESFLLQRIQLIRSHNILVCSVIHDNLAAQANAVQTVLESLEERPKVVDIPCFNHMLNLAFLASIDQCRPLRGLIKDVTKWQGLMRILRVKIPTIPKTRWIYVVEVLQSLSKVTNLDDLLVANSAIVRRQLGYEAEELPLEFIQLYEVLNPVYILSKQFEKTTTRLTHVIPLVRRCMSEWKRLNESMEPSDQFNLIIDYLVGNLLTRLRANAYEEAVTAYMLSTYGKDEISQDSTGSSAMGSSRDIEVGDNGDRESTNTPDISASNSSSSSDNEEPVDDEIERVIDELPETATQRRRELMDRHRACISRLSLREKLDYNFMEDCFGIANETLKRYGRDMEDANGGSDYYLVGLTKWVEMPLDQTIASLKLFMTSPDDQLDVCLWHHIFHLSRGHVQWAPWNAFAETALRFVLAGVSEADVERLLSVQKQIQGHNTTRISEEGLTARLRLYGTRSLSSIQRQTTTGSNRHNV